MGMRCGRRAHRRDSGRGVRRRPRPLQHKTQHGVGNGDIVIDMRGQLQVRVQAESAPLGSGSEEDAEVWCVL